MTRRAAMIWISNGQRAAVGALIGTALLVPWQVTAESSLQSGARTASVGATAHLDFRIVIPPVLALSIDGTGPAGTVPRARILSNTRHVLLTASAPQIQIDRLAADTAAAGGRAAPPRAGAAAIPVVDGPPGTVLIAAGRGSVITAETACQLGGPRPASTSRQLRRPAVVDLRPVVCTVAMP